jgi:Nuclease-related domain
LRSQIIRLKLGRDGEKAVGQFLEVLRERGCRVFHDLIGDGFNVDHVIIGRTGVYTVETKTISKPSGDAKVVFDGDRLLVNGRSLGRDPVVRSRAQANWLRDLLTETTGRTYKVKPVIVFPGWYVESSGSGQRDAPWVLQKPYQPLSTTNRLF